MTDVKENEIGILDSDERNVLIQFYCAETEEIRHMSEVRWKFFQSFSTIVSGSAALAAALIKGFPENFTPTIGGPHYSFYLLLIPSILSFFGSMIMSVSFGQILDMNRGRQAIRAHLSDHINHNAEDVRNILKKVNSHILLNFRFYFLTLHFWMTSFFNISSCLCLCLFIRFFNETSFPWAQFCGLVIAVSTASYILPVAYAGRDHRVDIRAIQKNR